MTLEQTKEAASSHTQEEIEQEMKDETEEQVSETNLEGETSKKDEELEEETDWKSRALKAEEEREHYKKGLLETKVKMRSIGREERQEMVTSPEPPQGDVNEEVVISVLSKQNERRVLREVIDSKSEHYMPELVDDNQYNEIIGYLPRNVDKTSQESIRKALKVAIAGWKYDRGITDEKPKIEKPEGNLSSSSTSLNDGSPKQEKSQSQGRKIIKQQQTMQDWY